MKQSGWSTVLTSTLWKLQIILVSLLASWALLLGHAWGIGRGLTATGDLIQSFSLIVFVLSLFIFVGLASQFAGAFDKNRFLFSCGCLLIPVGPIAIYWYFRRNIHHLVASHNDAYQTIRHVGNSPERLVDRQVNGKRDESTSEYTDSPQNFTNTLATQAAEECLLSFVKDTVIRSRESCSNKIAENSLKKTHGGRMLLHPQGIKGPWKAGIVLDWHTVASQIIGQNEFGYPIFDNTRSEIGELLYQFKYRNDQSALAKILEASIEYLGDKTRGKFDLRNR